MNKGIIHSGGAAGADSCFGNGVDYGYEVICHSFPGHPVGGKGRRLEHTLLELEAADPFLLQANLILQRRIPAAPSFVRNLLRRNYYQICDAEFVVAIAPLSTKFPEDIVDGGTGWAVEMALQVSIPVYVWNTKTKSWYTNINDVFVPHRGRVPNKGVFAGIGSRNIDAIDEAAIKELLTKE